MTTTLPAIEEAAAASDAALDTLIGVLRPLGDGDLHRAHVGGGWTVAQVVSHINLATLLWLGDLQRLAHDPDLDFFFREEVGHDAVGYPPPTVEIAVRQLEATRRTTATCLTAIDEAVLGRTVTVPDLGTRTVAEWTPPILGHAAGHVEQALEVLRNRGVLAQEA